MLRIMTCALLTLCGAVLTGCGGDQATETSEANELKGSTNPAASMMQRKADEMNDEETSP